MNAAVRWLVAGVLALAALDAQAGGPRVICGGAPVKFPGTGTVNLNYDLGTLGTRTKAQADAFVTNSVAIWTNVSTATFVFGRGPDLTEDVTTANLATYYPNTAANTSDGLNPVIYDTDGSIVDAIFGVGTKNNLLGFATTRFANCQFTEGSIIVSGFKTVSDATLGVVFAHEVGHLIGLDHTQLDNTQGIASLSNYPLMYPIANRSTVSLHEDEVAAVSLLYPDPTLSSVYGQITGTFVLADGVTPVRGANLWAAETTTGKVYSVVSDYLKQNTGFFRMLLPAGTYTLHAEAIQTAFYGASSVGPYAFNTADVSFQSPLYPTGIAGAPMAAVTLGNALPTTFKIVPACTASVTFGINGTGTVSGNCVPVAPGNLQFTAATASVAESAGSITVSVSRINGSDGPASVNIATTGITATPNVDYATQIDTLSWAAGDSAPKTFVVPIFSDSLIEGNETFTITLSSPAGASLGTTTTMTITIIDDDFATAPGAPANLVATAGNGQAFIAFTPPASDGGSPVVGYIATCGAVTAPGAGSPINITGLINDTPYNCTIAATNAVGTGTPSAPVQVTPSATAALALVNVVSRKIHGAAGAFELDIDATQPIGGQVTIEPRFMGNGGHTLVFQFNAAVSLPVSVSVDTPASGVATVVATNGNKLTVTLTGVADNQRATLTLTGVNGSAAVFPLSLGFLVGDFNSTRSVKASDISAAKAHLGPTGSANFRFDVNASGTVDQADLAAVKQRSGWVMP
jgi:hypothetical protein